MSDFITAVKPLAPGVQPAWLHDFSLRAGQRWRDGAFPTRKTEHWKYSPVSQLEKRDFFSSAPQATTPDAALMNTAAIAGLGSIDLVFVNGYFAPELSDTAALPAGVQVLRFSQADTVWQQKIAASLGSIACGEKHLFVALNNYQCRDGVWIEVAANARIERPLRIVHLTSQVRQAAHAPQRVFVNVNAGAALSLVEQCLGDATSAELLVNHVVELDVHDNAELHYYRLNLEHESAIHLAGVHANLHRDARLHSFYLSLGGQLKRFDVVVNHRGAGAHCEMKGIYLPRGTQHVDYHTCVEHAVPYCTTEEVFRGIISDAARAVFNGRIHIHKHAQKTFAQLSNKNLLTSAKAEINTKPELEIYADDVQCAHGATVAQLDATAMHYMKTRGISTEEAQVMMSFGFINELIAQVRLPALVSHLRPQLARLFSRDPELTKHLL